MRMSGNDQVIGVPTAQLGHYTDGVASIWWATLLAFGLWKRRFNFSWFVVDRAVQPVGYWMTIAGFAGVALWAGITFILGH
jgi:hypothetical protein